MTNTQRAAIQQAIDALGYAHATNQYESARQDRAIKDLRKALAEPVVEPVQPPFGSKRRAAMAVYAPPFRFGHGYIYDSQNKMVADDAQVEGAVASRVRGWGRLGCASIQDEIGQMIADALNAYYAQPPAAEPLALMSQPNREIAYSACAALRELGYVWGDKLRHWVAPRRVEVPLLTVEEILNIAKQVGIGTSFAQAIEQAVRQKAGIK